MVIHRMGQAKPAIDSTMKGGLVVDCTKLGSKVSCLPLCMSMSQSTVGGPSKVLRLRLDHHLGGLGRSARDDALHAPLGTSWHGQVQHRCLEVLPSVISCWGFDFSAMKLKGSGCATRGVPISCEHPGMFCKSRFMWLKQLNIPQASTVMVEGRAPLCTSSAAHLIKVLIETRAASSWDLA